MSEVPPTGSQTGPQPGPETGPESGPRPPAAPATGSAGRYQRSTNGLIGALLITLLFIGVFVAFRAINRDNPDVKPTRVDYLSAVDAAQQSGFKAVYPPTLPDGRFAGVRQEVAPLDQLLQTYVDEHPTQGPTVRIDSPIASKWQSFSDSGGDHAFATELGRDVVLVYGSASPEDLRTLAGDLTTAHR